MRPLFFIFGIDILECVQSCLIFSQLQINMTLLNEKGNISRLAGPGLTWRSNLLPSLLSLQTSGLATDLQLVTVGQQGDFQEPLLAHSLVLAAASPTLATILATSRDTGQVTLIMPGLERQELEGVL